MPGIHRMTDLVSPHPCPPYAPDGAGEPTICGMGIGKVLVNGLPCCVVACVTMIHNCINPEEPPGPHVGIYVKPRKVFACGLPVQAIGDQNNCLATCVTGSPNVMVKS